MACKRPWKIYQRSLNTSRGLILRSSFVNRALHAAAPRRQTTAGSFPLADQRDLWCLGDKMERGNENKITRSFPQEPLTSDGSAQARLWGTGWRDASRGFLGCSQHSPARVFRQTKGWGLLWHFVLPPYGVISKRKGNEARFKALPSSPTANP